MRELVWVRTIVSISTREERQPPRQENREPPEGENSFRGRRSQPPEREKRKPPEGENPFAREERQPQRGRKEKVQLSKDSLDRLHMIRTW